MTLDASANVYSGFALKVYDFWVLKGALNQVPTAHASGDVPYTSHTTPSTVSNWFAWRCPTLSVLVPLFDRYVAHSSSHLDVGAGTGFYPAQPSTVPFLSKLKSLAFLDLNPATLSAAKARVEGAGYRGPPIATHALSALRPLPAELHGKFDTVSLFYVLHCLPGSFPTKASHVAATLLPALAPGPDSTLYGATILGAGVTHNMFGRFLMWLYNRKGIFGNYEDKVDLLRAGLEPYFDEVEIEVVGAVAIFVCRGPKSQRLSN